MIFHCLLPGQVLFFFSFLLYSSLKTQVIQYLAQLLYIVIIYYHFLIIIIIIIIIIIDFLGFKGW